MDWQTLPKAELHLHLSGSYPKEYLFSISTPHQQEELEIVLSLALQKIEYENAFALFQTVNQIVDTEEKVTQGVVALCDSLAKDGVSYVEIRSGLKNLGSGKEAYLLAILEGLKQQKSVEAKILLSLQRNSSLPTVQETIALARKYRNQGVVGIDLSGDSTLRQSDPILPELAQAKDIPFVVHIGESPEEQDQMQLLTLLQPVRVGHGVHLSAEAAEWIVSKRIPLEVCLTSSVLVQMISRYDEHPGLQLFRKGHPIVFCTDDPLLFSTTLSQELFLAHVEAGLSKEEVEKIARDSFQYRLH